MFAVVGYGGQFYTLFRGPAREVFRVVVPDAPAGLLNSLARLELRVAIEEFIKRYPRFEVADSRAVTFAQGQVRGPRNLPFRVLA